jgi:RHS repeat-associated protein
MASGRSLTGERGNVHLRARYYAPSQGRFLTRDPFPSLLVQPASLTPYIYALNNPLRYTDPSGYFVNILGGALIGAIAGGGVYAVMNWSCYNWGEFLVAAGAGAVAGAIIILAWIGITIFVFVKINIPLAEIFNP